MPSQVCPAALLKLIGRYRWRERGFKGWLRETGQRVGPAFLFLPHRPLENGRILLANSPEQNCRGKICSHRGAKLDENRTSALTSSTIMQSMACDCRLAVISPAVSDPILLAKSGQAARAAKREVRVAARGAARNQAARRSTLIAAAVATCWRCVLASPR